MTPKINPAEIDDALTAPLVRGQNDAFRIHGPGASGIPGTVCCAGALAQAGSEIIEAALTRVRMFDAFDEDNDPRGEHDFGSFKLGSELIFWKIDYYDTAREYHSPDKTDKTLTHRVLTVYYASDH